MRKYSYNIKSGRKKHMGKRRSVNEWMILVSKYKNSGKNLTTWCRENKISKSSIYPYINKSKSQPSIESWGSLSMEESVQKSSISLTIGNITLDIKDGFNKSTLQDILTVVNNIC